jgi:hypothetical protein
VFDQKISPELFVAVVLSAVILVFMGALSYASKDNTFLYIGLLTVAFNTPIVLARNKL